MRCTVIVSTGSPERRVTKIERRGIVDDIASTRFLDGKLLVGLGAEPSISTIYFAGWSSPVAREAHNLEVVGSNPAPAT